MSQEVQKETPNIPGVKTILVGGNGVGKTCLYDVLQGKKFNECTGPVIGASYTLIPITHEEDTVNLELWDTDGNERYRSMVKMYYREAHIAICVYDITYHESWKASMKDLV